MALIDSGSLLVIAPLSGDNTPELAPYSARGVTQTLEQISGTGAGGNVVGTLIRETVDGRTIDLTPHWMKKYQSTVTCSDGTAPVLDGAFRGVKVVVHCACELSYWTGGSPHRTVVSGSTRTEGALTFYRPELIMVVLDIHNDFSEWPGKYSWRIDLREYQVPTL